VISAQILLLRRLLLKIVPNEKKGARPLFLIQERGT
jgi:hypothetical protein